MEKNIIYFDNAATTYPKPDSLYNKTMVRYRMFGITPGRGTSKMSGNASACMEETRDFLAKKLEVSSNKIHFTSSVTFSLNQIIKGLNMPKYASVYYSPFEHNSVVRTLNELSRNKNINLELLKFTDYTIDSNQFAGFFECDYLVLSHQSNVTGYVLPINEICKKVKGLNPECITIIDAAQCGGYYDIDWKYIDFYCFSGHKSFYGPSGIAGFVNNSNIELSPLLLGGTGIDSESDNMPNHGHERYEAGSHNILSIIGLNESLRWMSEIGVQEIKRKINKMIDAFIKNININKYQLYRTNDADFGSIVAFNHKTISPQDMAIKLEKQGFILRAGLHCSPNTHRHINTFNSGGTLRFSPGYFNEEIEVLELIKVLNDF